jgi:hypothetical protein
MSSSDAIEKIENLEETAEKGRIDLNDKKITFASSDNIDLDRVRTETTSIRKRYDLNIDHNNIDATE